MHKTNKARRPPKGCRRKRRYPMPALVVYLPHARAFARGDEEEGDGLEFWDDPQPCDLDSAVQLHLDWGMQFCCSIPEGGVLMMLPAARKMVRAGAYEAYLDYVIREEAPQGPCGGGDPQPMSGEDEEYVALAAIPPGGIVNDWPTEEEQQAMLRERGRKKRKARNRSRRLRARAVAKKAKLQAKAKAKAR